MRTGNYESNYMNIIMGVIPGKTAMEQWSTGLLSWIQSRSHQEDYVQSVQVSYKR